MDAPLVHLNPAEVDLVWQLARRAGSRICARAEPKRKAPVEGRWDRELEGLGAECAAAKLLGIYFDGPSMTTTKRPMLGRLKFAKPVLRDGCLRLYRSGPDERIALLFVGLLPNFRFGRMDTRRGRQARTHYWNKGRDRQPAFHVPQSDLAAWEPCLGILSITVF
jgi:hypothetical protein